MKHITFYFDFISPYAYLAFEQLPGVLRGISHSVEYKPVLFAGMLKHHGQLGPAEIAPKRDWSYRQVMWMADRLNVPLQMPASHPFNPLPLLRAALACSEGVSEGEPDAGKVNRYICELVFRHVWTSGAEMNDAAVYQALLAKIKPRRDPQGSNVKNCLKANTEAAISQGVFGVPAFEVDNKIFWGLDALPMLKDYLQEAAWFSTGGWERSCQVGGGIVRNK